MLAVVSDKRLANNEPDVLSTSDFYPFGMTMPGRKMSPESYRFGFNGKENVDEVDGWQDYGMRMYNRKIARFPTPDPIIVYQQKYPELSSYQYASLNPIRYIDIDGLEGGIPPSNDGQSKVKVVSKSEINVTIGPQFELSKGGKNGKGLGFNLTIANWNILKITTITTTNAETGETKSNWNFDWFTGDIASEAGLKTPFGDFTVKNKFKIDSDAEYIRGTQQTEYSYVTPKIADKAPVKGQVTVTKKENGEVTVQSGVKANQGYKFIIGVNVSTEMNVETSGTK